MTTISRASGLWYEWRRRWTAVTFVALLIDVGSRFSGGIHEYEGIVSEQRILLYAAVEGRREGSSVSFLKTYDGTGEGEEYADEDYYEEEEVKPVAQTVRVKAKRVRR